MLKIKKNFIFILIIILVNLNSSNFNKQDLGSVTEPDEKQIRAVDYHRQNPVKKKEEAERKEAERKEIEKKEVERIRLEAERKKKQRIKLEKWQKKEAERIELEEKRKEAKRIRLEAKRKEEQRIKLEAKRKKEEDRLEQEKINSFNDYLKKSNLENKYNNEQIKNFFEVIENYFNKKKSSNLNSIKNYVWWDYNDRNQIEIIKSILNNKNLNKENYQELLEDILNEDIHNILNDIVNLEKNINIDIDYQKKTIIVNAFIKDDEYFKFINDEVAKIINNEDFDFYRDIINSDKDNKFMKELIKLISNEIKKIKQIFKISNEESIDDIIMQKIQGAKDIYKKEEELSTVQENTVQGNTREENTGKGNTREENTREQEKKWSKTKIASASIASLFAAYLISDAVIQNRQKGEEGFFKGFGKRFKRRAKNLLGIK